MKELRMGNGDVIDADEIPDGLLEVIDADIEQLKKHIEAASVDPKEIEWDDAEDEDA